MSRKHRHTRGTTDSALSELSVDLADRALDHHGPRSMKKRHFQRGFGRLYRPMYVSRRRTCRWYQSAIVLLQCAAEQYLIDTFDLADAVRELECVATGAPAVSSMVRRQHVRSSAQLMRIIGENQ